MGAKFGFIAPLVSAGVLALASGCGTSGDDSFQSPAPATTTTTTTTTTTSLVVDVASAGSTPTTLPGTQAENPFIPPGAVLGVVGIAFDDTLSMHSLPGSAQPVVGTLPPDARDVIATGRAQLTAPAEVYLEVTAAGVTGWVDNDHVLYISEPRDITALAVSSLGGTPIAPSMLELGRLVVDAIGPPPDAPSRILVVVVAPTEGPIGEVTFDEFFGEEFGGDSIAGSRFRVVGRQIADDELPATGFAGAFVYELVSVESTGVCWRGVSVEGLCI